MCIVGWGHLVGDVNKELDTHGLDVNFVGLNKAEQDTWKSERQ